MAKVAMRVPEGTPPEAHHAGFTVYADADQNPRGVQLPVTHGVVQMDDQDVVFAEALGYVRAEPAPAAAAPEGDAGETKRAGKK